MGCNASKGTGPTKKFNDNNALKEEGLAQLTPKQLKEVRAYWNQIVKDIQDKKQPDRAFVLMQKEEARAVVEQCFKKADGDMDDYLNKDESDAFFADVWA